MMVVVLDICERELAHFPEEILGDFIDAVSRLREGLILSMPLSRFMPSIGRNIHELRFKDKNGVYRIFYLIKKKDAIYVVHALQKKTQKIPKKNIELVKKRIRGLS